MGRISTGLGTSWESALTLGFFVFRCFLGSSRSLSVRGVGVVCVYFRRRPGDDVCSGETGSLIRATTKRRDVFCGRRATPTSRRLFSRRARVRFVSLLFVRFFMHARRAPWNEWARHRPVDDRRYRSTSSFGRVKIVSCRSIVACARAYRCTSPRARIAAAVGARDRANPSFEGTSSREIRASISSACTPGWSRGRACRAGGFWGASIAPWERARV